MLLEVAVGGSGPALQPRVEPLVGLQDDHGPGGERPVEEGVDQGERLAVGELELIQVRLGDLTLPGHRIPPGAGPDALVVEPTVGIHDVRPVGHQDVPEHELRSSQPFGPGELVVLEQDPFVLLAVPVELAEGLDDRLERRSPEQGVGELRESVSEGDVDVRLRVRRGGAEPRADVHVQVAAPFQKSRDGVILD